MPRSKQEAMKRKKHRGRLRKEAPLPVLSTDRVGAADPPCRCFTGYLLGCSVIIQHSGDIDFLYNMGFFGKGNLSRSEPTFDARQQRVNLPAISETYDGTDMVQPIVTSKRKYLAHLRYKALSDDEESVYNGIVQQEQSQLSAYGDDDEEEEDLEDEDYEEEEYDIENSDIHALGRYSFKGDKKTKLTSEELYKMPRSLLMALMTQVALLSEEQMATFISVPCGLAELETKFKMMRAKQVAFLEGLSEAPRHTPLSTLFSSLQDKSSYAGSDSGFGKKGIISLEEANNDAVVVLNSDDEKDDGREEEEEMRRKRPNAENDQKAVVKGWDDSDNEGDADFWGLDEETEKDQGDYEKGNEDSERSINSRKDSTVSGDVDENKDAGTSDKETNKKDENEDKIGVSRKEIKDESSCAKKTEQNENVLDAPKEQNENNGGFDSNEGKEEKGELTASKPVTPDSCLVSFSLPSVTTTIASNTTTVSVENVGNSSDDDVICVEEESAKPAKLHQYLSQAPESNSTGHRIISKPVTFLTSITEKPKYVSTRIGFRSWDNVLHFNFSGDHNHLPTGMAVHKEVEGNKTTSESKSFTLSDSDTNNVSSHSSVYERVYPPINSLVASHNSRGSIMKQRNDPVPFLDLALYNLQQRFAPRNVGAPSYVPPPRTSSWHGPTSRIPHNVHHSLLLSQPHQKPPSWSHALSQPNQKDPQNISSHSQSSNSSSLSPSSSSLLSSKATVSLSQLQLYLQIFQEDTGINIGETEEENGKLTTGEEKVNSSDIDMQKLHTQLNKTGLSKMKTASEGLDSNLCQGSDDALSKQSALAVFHKMLSDFMTSQQISLEHELLLLRILMYDQKSVRSSAISREVVSDLKSKMSPGQVNCLLERMDFVQTSVENRRKNQLLSNEIITIDMSDDEEEKMDLEDEDDNIKDIYGKKDVSIDEMSGDNKKSHENNCEDGQIEKSPVTDLINKINTLDGENSEDDKKESSPVGDLISKTNLLDGEEEFARNSKERESIVVGVKRQFDLSDEVSESKKLKSGTEDSIYVNDQHLDDGLKIRTCHSSDIPNKGEQIDFAKDDGSVVTSAPKSDNTQNKSVSKTSSCLNEDMVVCLLSKHSSHGDEKGNQSERDGDDDDKKGKYDEELSVSENCVSISNSDCGNKTEILDFVGVEKVNGKESNSSSVKNGFNIGEEEGNRNGGGSGHAVEELNEIYVGSSDDENNEREGGMHGLYWAKKALSENRSVFNQYCGSDDVDGNNFVIANTSDEDEEDDDINVMNDGDNGGWQWKKKRWHPCLKQDPYPTEERLHLMLEEAFFLTFGLGCLRILDQEMTPMTISSLWQRFVVVQEKFIPRYVAYHYFRSKGWVPKSGLKFGCDFILYREGPPFYHGSFSVVVVPVKAGALAHMDGEDGELDFSHRWTSWIALSGLNRITEHVSKELMVCYVIFPKGLTEEESKSPKCLTHFKVKEIVVSRWVSARERESKDMLEEMP